MYLMACYTVIFYFRVVLVTFRPPDAVKNMKHAIIHLVTVGNKHKGAGPFDSIGR